MAHAQRLLMLVQKLLLLLPTIPILLSTHCIVLSLPSPTLRCRPTVPHIPRNSICTVTTQATETGTIATMMEVVSWAVQPTSRTPPKTSSVPCGMARTRIRRADRDQDHGGTPVRASHVLFNFNSHRCHGHSGPASFFLFQFIPRQIRSYIFLLGLHDVYLVNGQCTIQYSMH